MKDLYEALKVKLESIDISDLDASLTLWVDLFNNQLEKKPTEEGGGPPSSANGKMPCALIEFKSAEYQQLGKDIQRKILKIVLHVGHQVYGTDGTSTEEALLLFFELRERVHRELQGFVDNSLRYTPLIRVQEEHFTDEDQGEDQGQDDEYDTLYIHKITYETIQTDTSAYRNREKGGQFVTISPGIVNIPNSSE